ncbi:hypothetical protein ACVWXE_002040 [Thermostichus sp. MS-CIW-41]
MISSTILKIMYNMFSTDYYQLIFLFTFYFRVCQHGSQSKAENW